MKKGRNWIGVEFGKWTVTKIVHGTDKHKTHQTVECECFCGTKRVVRLDNLRSGGSTNCGCQRREDLIGKVFGKLTVVEFLSMTDDGRDQKLRCTCFCGSDTIANSDDLRRLNKQSCGCLLSSANEEIASWLEVRKFIFKREFRDLRCKRIKPLPFDFAVTVRNQVRLIEFQGWHHYHPSGPGGEKTHHRTKESDKIKRAFCEECNIPLLCIPYWEHHSMFSKIEAFLSDEYTSALCAWAQEDISVM